MGGSWRGLSVFIYSSLLIPAQRAAAGLDLGGILQSARADLNTLRRETPSLFGPAMAFAPFTVQAARAALTERRLGRKGYGLPFFAQLAKDYVDRLRAGDPRPAATVARARGFTPERVRDLIHRARKHGLLTAALLPGQKSGELRALRMG